jgi:signal-transduction protein with cAMP-binding, CBS, and nucleotidyltransferase domain
MYKKKSVDVSTYLRVSVVPIEKDKQILGIVRHAAIINLKRKNKKIL